MLNALNLGVWGRAPGGFLLVDGQRVYPGLGILIEFFGSQLPKLPLTAIIVIIIHPVINQSYDFFICFTGINQIGDFVFHMTEKALLWGIIPAVAAAGHRLDKLCVLQLLYEGVTGIMTSVVAVNNRCIIQCASMFLNKPIYSFEHEINFESQTDAVTQDFMRKSINDRGKITSSAFSKEEISDICQQYVPCSAPEPPITLATYGLLRSFDISSVFNGFLDIVLFLSVLTILITIIT